MKQFQQYGITAEVRDDGDLFIRAADVTVGIAESVEFFTFLADAFGVETEPADQADADAGNNEAYNAGSAPVIETTAVPAPVKRGPGRPRKNPA